MKYIILTLGLVIFGFATFAQNNEAPTLPYIKIETIDGSNKLSWICNYEGLKSVIIERSTDSVLSFTNIGYIAKPKKGLQTFEDPSPLLGKNYYKVKVLFQSELEWFSNTYKVILDSATIAASRGRSLATGSTNAKSGSSSGSGYTDFYFEPSRQVYTNPYTGHILINLPEALEKNYSIKFYNPDKEEVLAISRVRKKQIVLDKYNLSAKGSYMFKLFEKDEIAETGYVTLY